MSLMSSFWGAKYIMRVCRYHIGSIAFGSLLIAICQLIRVFLEFLDRRLKGREKCVAKFLIKWV